MAIEHPDLLPLKTGPKYGYYPWWPEDGDQWVHPEDIAVARSHIPSPRVFRREEIADAPESKYLQLRYGDLQIRVVPTLWREVRWENFDIGDMVEVRPQGMENEHLTGVISEMVWDEHAGGLKYEIDEADFPAGKQFSSADLKHVEQPDDREETQIEPGTTDAYELENPS